MKITKNQLRKMIKEEKQKILKEQRSPEFEFAELSDSIIGLLRSLDPADRNPMAYELIDELENLVSRG